MAPLANTLPVDSKDRVPNRGGNCAFASVETLARAHGIKELYGLSASHGACHGAPHMRQVLTHYGLKEGIDFKLQAMGNKDNKLLCEANGGLGAAVGVDGNHMITLTRYYQDGVCVIDNAGPQALQMQTWTTEQFHRRWDGFTVLLCQPRRPLAQVPKMPPAVIEPKTTPLTSPDIAKKLDDLIALVNSGKLNGKDGKQGSPGAPGAPGSDGKDGNKGSDGKPGLQGPAGLQGLPGKDGASADASKITDLQAQIELLNSRFNNLQLRANLYDVNGNLKTSTTFGPNQPLELKLLPVPVAQPR